MLTRIVRPSPALDTFLQPLIPLLSLLSYFRDCCPR